MPNIGVTELLIILVIVVLLFGAGRIGRLGGELGEAIGNFRKGMEKAKNDEKSAETPEAPKKA
jgi:sec-independent protein translocase protein TatA